MIVLAALRIRSFNRDALTSDPTFSLAEFLCWTSAELNYSILSATLPIVRPLISNLATHYGGGFGQSDGRTYADGSTGSYVRSGARGDSKSDTIQLRSMGRNRGDGSMRQSAVRRSRGEDWGHDKAFGRAGRAAVATGEHSNQDAVSVESSDSQRMIIRKDVTWVVDHDHESMGG